MKKIHTLINTQGDPSVQDLILVQWNIVTLMTLSVLFNTNTKLICASFESFWAQMFAKLLPGRQGWPR